MVIMPKTSGWPDLDISQELDAFRQIGVSEPDILDALSKVQVLRKLRESSVAHFACHGLSDSTDPSNSRLFLADDSDGLPEYLTVRDLSEISLSEAQIVYISACSTAENSSRHLLDENIHIASAFLLVGFPHVVGTMWEAFDFCANDVSQTFYRQLVQMKGEWSGCESHDVFAYALHEAVKYLRETGSDNVIGWAHFIHLGC